MSFTVLHRVRLNIHTRNMYHENTKTRLSQLKERKHFFLDLPVFLEVLDILDFPDILDFLDFLGKKTGAFTRKISGN